jgi:choline kinase
VKCIILAAGTSSRMKPLTENVPKCLLSVGGKTILQRMIELVSAAGVGQIGIVLGYRAEKVRTFVKRQFPFHRVRFIVNPKYESTNNAFSLLMAREFFMSEARRNAPLQELLLLDSDIIFSPELLPCLFKHESPNRIAVRVQGEHDEEEIRVRIDRDRNIMMIGKTIPADETFGESIGIELFSPAGAQVLFETVERRVRNGSGRTEFYEASFQEMIEGGVQIRAVDTSRYPAVEIDTPEDLEVAEKIIIPQIELAGSQGGWE